MRHPGPRLPAIALRRLRARQARRVQLQAARLVSFMRGTVHGPDGGALVGPRPRKRSHAMAGAPVRRWLLIEVIRLPITLRLQLAAQHKLVTFRPQVVHRVITRHLRGQAGFKPDEADSSGVTLIQRFGSAAILNMHLHCLVLDGVSPAQRRRHAVAHRSPPRRSIKRGRRSCTTSVADEVAQHHYPIDKAPHPSELVEEVDQPGWPTTPAIRTRSAHSCRCRPRRVPIGSPSVCGPAKRY